MDSRMKTAGLFLFAAAFLFVGTSGVFTFVAYNLERTTEYAESDLRTMLGLIRDDLRLGRRVVIDVPFVFLTPRDNTVFRFDTELLDENNNWIDATLEVPRHYAINGSFQSMAIEQLRFHVVALNTSEIMREDGSASLRLDTTVWVENLRFSGGSNLNGTWGRSNISLSNGFFIGHFEIVQARFEMEFELTNGEGLQSRSRYLGPMNNDQATMTVTNVTTRALRTYNSRDQRPEFQWFRDSEHDDSSVDEFVRRVMMLSSTDTITAFEGLLRRVFGRQPYSAPSITIAAIAANASGYECMASMYRRRQ